MSSATTNRPSGGFSNATRPTHFGDFPSTTVRMNGDDKKMPASSLGQAFNSSNTWQTSVGIWGNSTIGSGLNGMTDVVGRSRGGEESTEFHGISGSGALAASSEADPWSSRTNGPWNVSNASPTSNSGTASPIRHRSSNSSVTPSNGLTDSQTTSPFMTTSRPAIGQGPGVNGRAPVKSNLDPSSGPFKYPYNKRPVFGGFGDNKENIQHSSGLEALNGFSLEQGYRSGQGSSSASREPSLPPSSSGTSSSSIFTNSGIGGFGHTPNNSVHIQRPSSGRAPSFPSLPTGRISNGLLDRGQELESNYGRNQQARNSNENVYLDSQTSAFDQSVPSPEMYPSHESRFQLGGSSAVWNQENSSSSNSHGNYGTQASPQGSYQGNQNSSKASRSRDHETMSSGNDYRQNPQSPRFYNGNIELGQGSFRAVRSQADLENGFLRLQISPQQGYFPPQPIFAPFQGQYPAHAYDRSHHQPYAPTSAQFNNQYAMPMTQYPQSIPAPRGPARDQDVGHGVRSVLLEEFRSSGKSNKRYELKDIYNHVVEFSGDQHGSRFIQQKLETANSDEKEQLFREIQPNALQLMTDVFGNYVIQKLFEHGNQVQKKVLAESMKHHVTELSQQMYGCRVVQKALEHVLADQQAELVKELEPDVLSCVKDQNGNHVIQKAIERAPAEQIRFIIEAFRGQVHTLATHPYGCRVVQRLLEFCAEKDKASILEELFSCANMLITDQYGNYVIQHVIAGGKKENRDKIVDLVISQLIHFSKHKFASNVVEKAIQCCSEEQRRVIVAKVTALHTDGSSPLQLMMRDQFGNYVVQKLLAQLQGAEREHFVEAIKPQLLELKKFNYGKQIAAMEKLIYAGPSPVHHSPSYPSHLNMMASPSAKTMPLDINSSVATPMLTMEQNSPQSSSLPSTNASTVDGPTEPTGTKLLAGKVLPEVRIESV